MTQYLRAASDPEVLTELCGAIDRGRCVLAAGPGLCAEAHTVDGRHPPLFEDLLKGMANWCSGRRLIDPDQAADIHTLIEKGFCVEAGQELEELLSDKSIRQQCLRDVLLCNEANVSSLHIHLATIGFRAYLATYYDTLIETAYSAVRRSALAKYYESSSNNILQDYNEGHPFILKLHGDVDNQDSIILGDRSYERILHHAIGYRDCLQSLISMSSILFLGFRVSDPDLEGLVSKVAAFSNPLKRHWIVVPEGHIPPLKAKRLWSDRRISVIQYKVDATHSALESFLEQLAMPLSRVGQTSEQGTKLGSFGVSAKIESFGNRWISSSLASFSERSTTMSTRPRLSTAIEVFFSYAHEDEELRNQLDNHIALLRQQGVIAAWYDRKIGAGREWDSEIEAHLNAASIILLLVSANFLASGYCYGKEMTRAMERHEAGEARVIPVILRPVDWQDAPFGKLQALPKDATPVTSWGNIDEAFMNVAQGIRAAVQELMANP